MPKISVIMPVYNTKEEWLREAIESILNQTYTDFEFIIVDDGSTEPHVRDTVLSYKDERIKYFYKENGGISTALNFGWDNAKGEYIARMDSDDISRPERFAKQIAHFEQHPEISVLGGWFYKFLQDRTVKHPEKVDYLRLYRNCCVGHPTVMFRKADFDKYNLRYTSDYRCEDYDLWSKAIRYLKFENLQEVLLDYRWHGDNLSTVTKEFSEEDKKVKQNMLNFLTSNPELQAGIEKLVFKIQPKPTILQKIFSIRNEKKKKVIRILGVKISIKRKQKVS